MGRAPIVAGRASAWVGRPAARPGAFERAGDWQRCVALLETMRSALARRFAYARPKLRQQLRTFGRRCLRT